MTDKHIYLEQMTVQGFKSIKTLVHFPLRSLNLLIRAKGAGKYNFIKALTLLNTIIDKKLQLPIAPEGGADDTLHSGQKITAELALA